MQATACNFVKKEIPAQVFSCEFCEIYKNIFFTEHLWETAHVIVSATELNSLSNAVLFTIIQLKVNEIFAGMNRVHSKPIKQSNKRKIFAKKNGNKEKKILPK